MSYSKYLFLAILTSSALVADQDGSIASVIEAVRSSLREKQSDQRIATLVKNIVLKQQLEERVLEQLESEGTGPKTTDALDDQKERSRELPKPTGDLKLFAAPMPPSKQQQSSLIEAAREKAVLYSAQLPNFIATENIRRLVKPNNAEEWKQRDSLSVSVAYSVKGEQYKLLSIDGKSTTKQLKSVGGFKSSGEFGSLLRRIFNKEAEARFEWQHWTNLHGKPVQVFSYLIDKAHSKYTINYGMFLKRYKETFGMKGLIYIDPKSHDVVRFTVSAMDIPAKWPFVRTLFILDYDYGDVGGQRFLLPKRVDARIIGKELQRRNFLEFRDFRKFSSEATVSFE